MIGLNYQGEGIGGSNPTFPSFRSRFPDKMIFSTESSSAVSSRGTYIFPVVAGDNAAVSDRAGGDSRAMHVSDYGLYAVSWGASPDRVFAAQDRNAYAAGQFVWTGTDYIGETTPYDGARSSYFGIIDLAGFPKDRFYLYQQQWRPDYATAHIVPHWTWPDRVGQVTPVHVFSAADEAELFLNGKSLGRQRRPAQTYRFRWDTVTYQPGELSVITYKGQSSNVWANATVRTTGTATKLRLRPDRNTLVQGRVTDDLSFVTAEVVDDNGDVVPVANNAISFSVSGPGEIVATDNGDPTDLVAFPSKDRKAFRGLALVIVRPDQGGGTGAVTVTAKANGLETAQVTLKIE
jgi:beta-galactosidase